MSIVDGLIGKLASMFPITEADDEVTGPFAKPPRFRSAADWSRALGDVPLERVVMRPWPGTATERDLTLRIDRGDDVGDHRSELIDGTLVDKALSFPKGVALTALSRAMVAVADRGRLGYVIGSKGPIRMASGNVRAPDLYFVPRSSLPDGRLPREPIAACPPSLAADVFIEGNTRNEMAIKRRDYFDSGCRIAWLIDLETQTCEGYHGPDGPTRRLTAADDLDGEDVLPGFKLRLGELFADV